MLGLPFHVVFQLEDVTTVEELQELVDSEEFNFRYDIGVAQPSKDIKMGDCTHCEGMCNSCFSFYKSGTGPDMCRAECNGCATIDKVKCNVNASFPPISCTSYS